MQDEYFIALEKLGIGLELAEKIFNTEGGDVARRLLMKIKKEVGNVLKETKGEFKGKNCYDYWAEAQQLEQQN